MPENMDSVPVCQHDWAYGKIVNLKLGQPKICRLCGDQQHVNIVGGKGTTEYDRLIKKKQEGGFNVSR
jgi:hypothetical protein